MATPADTATTHPGRDESPPHPWTLAQETLLAAPTKLQRTALNMLGITQLA